MDSLESSPTPSVEFAMVADAVQAVGGKLYVLGGGWDLLWVSSFPARHPSMGIGIRIRVPWSNIEQFSLSVDLVDEDGNSLFGGSGSPSGSRSPAAPGGPPAATPASPGLSPSTTWCFPSPAGTPFRSSWGTPRSPHTVPGAETLGPFRPGRTRPRRPRQWLRPHPRNGFPCFRSGGGYFLPPGWPSGSSSPATWR